MTPTTTTISWGQNSKGNSVCPRNWDLIYISWGQNSKGKNVSTKVGSYMPNLVYQLRLWPKTLPWPHTITNIIILISNNCTSCHVQRIHKFQAMIIFKDFEEWKYYKLHRMKPFSEKAKPVDRNLTNGYCFSSRCSLKDNFSQCWEP